MSTESIVHVYSYLYQKPTNHSFETESWIFKSFQIILFNYVDNDTWWWLWVFQLFINVSPDVLWIYSVNNITAGWFCFLGCEWYLSCWVNDWLCKCDSQRMKRTLGSPVDHRHTSIKSFHREWPTFTVCAASLTENTPLHRNFIQSQVKRFKDLQHYKYSHFTFHLISIH